MMAEAYPKDIVEPESVGTGDGEEMGTRLESYPGLFFLQNAGMSTSRLEALKRKIQGIQRSNAHSSATTLDSDLPSEDRTTGQQYTNILVYVLWRLKHVQEAEQLALEALNAHPKSILTRTNMAYILWRKGEVSRAEEQLQALTGLRESLGKEWQDLVVEARLGLAFFYYLCEVNFYQHAVIIYEHILQERPGHDKSKLFLARVLKKLTSSEGHTVSQTQSLKRAIELLNEIKNRPENNAQLRGEAAAELGEIFSYIYRDERRRVVESMSESLNLDADHCFKEALHMAKDNANILVKVAMHYRLHGKEEKANDILKKLIDLQPLNATGHYQLGLVLQQRALRAHAGRQQQSARRPTWQSQGNLKLEPAMLRSAGPIFTRDRVVERAMICFNKAQEVDHGDYVAVWYNLGLMHTALGEYDAAMCHFQRVLEKGISTHSTFTGHALEQSSLVMLQVEKRLTVPAQKQEFRDTAQDLLNMAAIVLSRIVFNTRKRRQTNMETWKSLFTLSTALKTRFELPKDETQLLLLLKRHRGTFLTRYELSRITQAEADKVEFLKDTLHNLQRNQHYHDAVLYVALLRLTNMRHALDTWRESDLDLQVHVQAARKLLRSKVEQNDVYYKVRTCAAALLFRWAFEDRFCAAAQRQHQGDDNNDHDLVGTEELHVLIVHESRDLEDAATLQRVLQATCRLTTGCTDDTSDHTAGSSTFCKMVQAAQVVLFLVTADSISFELQRLIQNSVTLATPPDNDATNYVTSQKPKLTRASVLSVVKGNAALPAGLQGRPSLPWNTELAVHDPERSLSEGQSNMGGAVLLAMSVVVLATAVIPGALADPSVILWTKIITSVTPATFDVNVTSRTLTECSRLCYDKLGCGEFCFKVITKQCHATRLVTSSQQQNGGMECYELCPRSKGYRTYKGRCIKLYTDHINYYNAAARCLRDGAHLYHYKALQLDQQPVLDVYTAAAVNPEYVWVGVTDEAVEGTFVWTDGSPLPRTSQVWTPGEPQGGTRENCAVIDPLRRTLNDTPCGTDLRHSICQIDIKPL